MTRIMTDVEYKIQEIDKNYQATITQIARLESLTKNNTISLNKLEGIKQSLELQIGQVIEKINQITKNQTSVYILIYFYYMNRIVI